MGNEPSVFATGPEEPILEQAQGLPVSYVAASAGPAPTVWWTLGDPRTATVLSAVADARAQLGCATGPLRIDERFIGAQQARADALAAEGLIPCRVDVGAAVPPACAALTALL